MTSRSRAAIEFGVVAGGSLVLLALVRWRAITDPALLGYDESLYLVQGQALADGLIPGRDTWVNKPPLLAFLFALGPLLFGLQTIPVRAMQLVSLWLAGLVCWRAARAWGGPVAGAAAGLALPLLTSTGLSPSELLPCFSEPFFVLPLSIALVATLLSREQPARRRALLALATGGAALGVAIQLRQNGLLLVPVLGLAAWLSGNDGRRPTRLSSRLASTSAWTLGVVASFLPVLLFLLYENALAGAWFWSWSLPREIHTFSPMALAEGAIPYLWSYVSVFPRLAVLALVGVLSTLGALRWLEGSGSRVRWSDSAVLLLFLGTCAAMCVAGGRFFQHYLVMLGPAMAVFVGFGARSIWVILARPGIGWGRILRTAALLYLAYHEVRGVRYAVRLARDVQPFELVEAAREGELLRRVRGLTRPGDLIFVLGSSPGLYYRSGRSPASPDLSGEVLQAGGVLSQSLWERPVPGLDGRRSRPVMQVLADGLERGKLVLDLTSVPIDRRGGSAWDWKVTGGADWLLSGQWVNWKELEGRTLDHYPILAATIREKYRPLAEPVEGVTVYVRKPDSGGG